MQVNGVYQADATDADVYVQVQYPDGRVRDQVLPFQLGQDGWQWAIPPILVDKQSAPLTGVPFNPFGPGAAASAVH